MDCDGQAAACCVEVALGDALPLVEREQDSLAGRPEREQPVEARPREEVDVRPDRLLVGTLTAGGERREGGRECASDQQWKEPVTLLGGLSNRVTPVKVPRVRPPAIAIFSEVVRTT